MKFGAHGYMYAPVWTDDHNRLLEHVRGLGADWFEIGVGDDVVFSNAQVRRQAEAVGLELTLGPGGAWPLACDLASDHADERAAGLRWHRRQVDRAAEVGAVAYCGALYAHPGVVKRRRPPPDEYGWTAEGLHLLAGYAAARGILIVLEPMSHFRTHLVNTPDQMVRLIRLADHPNLRICLDTYHLITEVTDYSAAIRIAAPLLWGVHACENHRGRPGTGIVPWADVFAALREVSFDGYLGLETYNSAIGDFAYERGMFHNVCPDPDRFVREGFAFLKAGLGRT
jgi:D-psicose/D-tagatose/L-ribulose 3-epimerase